MNPYDRRAVRTVWARVRPDRDVFAPGPRPGPPAPPSAGQGGKPPGGPSSPGGPSAPSAPGGPPGIPPEPVLPALRALELLGKLAAGYDGLSGRLRAPVLRRLAAQCRSGGARLRDCAGLRPLPVPPEQASVRLQREREQELRARLAEIDPGCARLAGVLACDSRARSRLLSRLR